MSVNFPRVTLRKFLKFMDRLKGVENVSKSKLAKSLGYKSVVGISSHISTALAMDLVKVTKEEIELSDLGKKFRESNLTRRKIITDFLLDDVKGLGTFSKSLEAKGRIIPIKDIRDILMMFVEKKRDAEILAGNLTDWYEFANLFKKRKDFVESYLIFAKQIGVISNYFELGNVERKIYMDLVSFEFDNPASAHPLSYHNIKKQFPAIETAEGKPAEGIMKNLVSSIFTVIGFTTQYQSGPRQEQVLKFKDEGDDLLVVFPRLDPHTTKDIGGVALACELKKSKSSKKAVMQATTFSDVVEKEFPSFLTFPIVISGRERYMDRAARGYASTSSVIHIPLQFLKSVLDMQYERFHKGEKLITPIEILLILSELFTQQEVEPFISDLLRMINEKLR
jgi:hypothetical protein